MGRLTFTETMAGAIFHLLGYREGDMEPTAPAPYGLYNCTNSGDAASWAKIAAAVFDRANGNGGRVVPVSTADYYANAARPHRPAPRSTPRWTSPSSMPRLCARRLARGTRRVYGRVVG